RSSPVPWTWEGRDGRSGPRPARPSASGRGTRRNYFGAASSRPGGSGARKKSSSHTVPLKTPDSGGPSGRFIPNRSLSPTRASTTNRTHTHFFSADGQTRLEYFAAGDMSGRASPRLRNLKGTG